MANYPIPISEREREYSKKYERNNQTLVYFVSPERLEELYPSKKKKSKNSGQKKEKNKGRDKKMKINMEIVREELEKGLDRNEIAKKYEANLRAVGMLISKVNKRKQNKKLVKKEEKLSTEKEDKIIPKPNQKQEEEAENLLAIKTMDIEGQIFKYRIEGSVITIIRDNRSMRIDKEEVSNIIIELQNLIKIL